VSGRPSFVPVRLRDLIYGAEFVTTLTRRRGAVSKTGWYPWDDGTGRTTRLRSVLVRYSDGTQTIHRAEMRVLVEADTLHARFSEAEEERRWAEQLRDPDAVSTLGELVRAKPRGLPC
jgi:hypothetical protein